MMRIGIVGTGNVASHLAVQFKQLDGIELLCAFSRSKSNATDFQDLTEVSCHWDPTTFPTYLDILITAVKDDRIGQVAERYKAHFPGALAVHTSGSVSSTVFQQHFVRFGVFYPLQSFTKGAPVDFSTIPICVHSNDQQETKLLLELGHRISDKVWEITDEQREHLHVAAVMVNNFTNFLYILAKDYVDEQGMDFKILLPLIQETVQKLEHGNPVSNQTGPAVRRDLDTVSKHLHKLQGRSPYSLLYSAFSGYIRDYFEKLGEQKKG